jgi:hypothetical protein
LLDPAAPYGVAQVQGGIQLLYIDHCGAVVADEVGVGLGVPLESLIPCYDTHGTDEAFFFKHGQVPIHGAKGQIRDPGLELGVDPFGRGMGVCGTDTL